MKATLTRVLIVLGLLITSFATARQPQTAAAAADCQYVLGFATLHALIPQTVGDCAQNEYFNPANGDSLQQTSAGLLVWRKADNWTAFTDGYRTWVNGPNGVQERLNSERFCWEGDAGAKLTDGLCAVQPASVQFLSLITQLNDCGRYVLLQLVRYPVTRDNSFISLMIPGGQGVCGPPSLGQPGPHPNAWVPLHLENLGLVEDYNCPPELCVQVVPGVRQALAAYELFYGPISTQ